MRFGVFELDLRARELRKHGIQIKLQEQPFQVLQALLERPGEIVTREELRLRIWGNGTFVDFDHSLNRAVNKLREALGDGAGTPRFIETLPRRGYRFIGVVDGVPRPGPVPISVPPEAARPEWWVQASSRASFVLAAAVVAAIGLVVMAYSTLRETPAPIPMLRAAIAPPDKAAFVRVNGVVESLAISPDGRSVAFSAKSGRGVQLWVRSLDSLAARPLAGTEGAAYPFWSPDGRSIGFAAEGKLKTVEVGGGPALTLADAPNLRGGTWSRDGVILFAPHFSKALQRVSAAGGDSRPARTLKPSETEEGQSWPWFLPDGRHFLFSTQSLANERLTTRSGSLDSTETQAVLEADSNAIFAGGYLIFLRESTLMAQPFDLKRLKTTGNPTVVAEMASGFPPGKGPFSVSGNGVLVYAEGQQRQLTWFDRDGRRLSTVGDPGWLGRMHLSPDQRRLSAAVITNANTDIWVYHLPLGVRTRLTFHPKSDAIGVWMPDGRTVILGSNARGHFDLYRKAADGAGGEELLYADDFEKGPTSVSPDGRILLYSAMSATGGWDIWALPLALERPGAAPRPQPFLRTPYSEQQAQFSPDGRWVSYVSDESGRGEVYVARFPDTGGKRRVSVAGGSQPRWRKDGKEIFYIAPEGELTVVPVRLAGATTEIGVARVLFGPLLAAQGFSYDVSADGQRILAEVPSQDNLGGGKEVLTLVQNWTAGLKK
jgi:Tol biopolymer transport system component/DNA-binding winged helix-turn-helix (wHTH) protein